MLETTPRSGKKARGLACACAMITCFAWSSQARAYTVQLTGEGANVRWHGGAVTLRIEPELEGFFGDMPVADLVTSAAAAWRGLPHAPELVIARGKPEPLGFHDNRTTNGVYLVEDWKLWPDALAATVTTFETESGKLVDADVQVNANFNFALLTPDGAANDRYDMLAVLTHEMGHVLGLGDASDSPGATMWPTIAPGDTYQRDIDADDEAGVEQAYAGALGSESLSGAGCGGASVLGLRSAGLRHGHGLLLAALSALVIWIWLRTRARRSRSARAIALGGVLLFGSPFSPAPVPREQPGVLGAEPPAQVLPREHPVAKKRLAEFVRGAERVLAGRAQSREAHRHDGLIWTHYRVQGMLSAVDLACPGGTYAGLTQVVSGHVPPEDGELVVVAVQKHGPHAWAHYRDGYVYGGTLGEGPGLEWR